MTHNRCLVSVITPLYNTEKYIAECIDSVLNQTFKDVEMLVVDDGSRDRSAEIVLEIAARDSRVRLLRHPGGVNLGVSRTRRLGIMEASGEYISYLDADDAFEPTKLERQVDLLKSHPACLLCHTGITAITVPVDDQEQSRLMKYQADSYANGWNNFRPEVTEYSYLDRDEALRSNVICNSSAMVVTAAVRSAAAASRQVFQCEDFTQWTLLATKGPFVFTPEPLTLYRVHPESSSFSLYLRDYLKHLYTMIEYLLTVHVLTDDSGLKIRVEPELFYTLARIMEVYGEQGPSETADSHPESPQTPGQQLEYMSEKSALRLQLEVNDLKAHVNGLNLLVNELKAQVSSLSDTLTTIRSSRVYQGLSKIRKVLYKN
jgi:glycosyltransferase involved in cell wall biosynthesis